MLPFLRQHVQSLCDEPVERLVKPALKAVAVIGGLSIAAHAMSDRSLDKQGLSRLAGSSQGTFKDPPTTGSVRRR